MIKAKASALALPGIVTTTLDAAMAGGTRKTTKMEKNTNNKSSHFHGRISAAAPNHFPFSL